MNNINLKGYIVKANQIISAKIDIINSTFKNIISTDLHSSNLFIF